MASSLRLPVGSVSSTARLNLIISQSNGPISQQCRSFSQASQRWGYKSQNFNPRTQVTPSLKARREEAMKGQLPNDMGLLPGTFVRPLWRDMPSIFQSPRDRWLMEWTSLKSFFQNYVGLAVYCHKTMKVPTLLRERRKIVQRLHSKMYTALAKGDVTRLRNICCDGLAEKLIKQIEARPSNQKVTWTLLKWLRRPNTFFTGLRIVSDRATQLPGIRNSGIRQIVARMTSKQSMQKSTVESSRGQPTKVDAPAKVQDCDEYIVIQQIIWNGKKTDWRVWGHATPSSLEQVQNDPYFAPGLSIMERIEAMKNLSGR